MLWYHCTIVLLLLCLHMDALTRSSAMGNHGQGPARKERSGTLRNPAKERVIFLGEKTGFWDAYLQWYAQMSTIVGFVCYLNYPAIMDQWFEPMKCCSWGPFARCSRASPFSIADLRVILENLTCPQFGSHPHVFPRWFVSKLQPNGTSRMKYHGIWTSPDFAYFNLSSTLVFMLPFGKLRITIQHFPTFNGLHTTRKRWIFQPVQPSGKPM